MDAHDTEIEEARRAYPASGRAPAAGRVSLLKLMWRRKLAVLLSMLVCVAGGVVYTLLARPLYSSTARLYVEQTGPKILEPEDGFTTRSDNYLYTQVALLKSTPILAGALQSAAVSDLRTLSELDDPLGYLKDHLTIRVGKNDEIISVSAGASYPEDAARLTNAIVDSYVAYHSEHKCKRACEVLEILRREKKELDGQLNAKLQAMLDFKEAHRDALFEDEAGRSVVAESLARVSRALTEARLRTIEMRAYCEAIRAILADPVRAKKFAGATHTGTLSEESATLRKELNALALQLIEWRTACTEDHPAIRSLREKISLLEDYLAMGEQEFVAGELARAQMDFETAKQREREIRDYVDQERRRTLGLNALVAEHRRLRSEWENAEKLIDVLAQRIREIDITDEAGGLNIRILETAYPVGRPRSPHKERILAVAAAMGLLLGVGLSLLLDNMNRGFRCSEEVAAVLGVPVVGVVPTMPKKRSLADRGRTTLEEPASPAAEAYRNIRTAVYCCAARGHVGTLLVTSVVAGDGKSTLVSNLAIAMAQTGRRTLIIDADFRRPGQDKIFGVAAERGISDVLVGRVGLESAIYATGIDQLDVLPCGPVPERPCEMLHSKRLPEILSGLSEKYDCIVIDSPPATPITDAWMVGAMCDMTLLVLRAETATRALARHACDGLLGVGARILGSVVNAVSSRDGRYESFSVYNNHHLLQRRSYATVRMGQAREDRAAMSGG